MTDYVKVKRHIMFGLAWEAAGGDLVEGEGAGDVSGYTPNSTRQSDTNSMLGRVFVLEIVVCVQACCV